MDANLLHACTKRAVFLQKICPQKLTVKKMKLTSSVDELVQMFLNKKRKKLRFWVHPVLKEGSSRENFMV